MKFETRKYQQEAIEKGVEFFLDQKRENGIIVLPTGCHAKGYEIMMCDGSLKKVEDIVVGDIVMGDNCTPREVLRLHRGQDEMYKITPVHGEPFVVNGDHILHLYRTPQGNLYPSDKSGYIEISVADYIKKSGTFKHLHKLHRGIVTLFDNKAELPLDPYFIGLLLGDGSMLNSINITTMRDEVRDYIYDYAHVKGYRIRENKKENNKATTYFLLGYNGKKKGWQEKTPLRKDLEMLGLWGLTAAYKHIPQSYLTSSLENRRKLLAGFFDTDSNYDKKKNSIEYCSKSKRLVYDIQFLCRSLGLYCSVPSPKIVKGETYYRMNITGDLNEIPNLVDIRKGHPREQKKNIFVTGFFVESVGIGDYYGFELDGNHLYLDWQFFVHHNSGKAYVISSIADRLSENLLVFQPSKEILEQNLETMKTYTDDCSAYSASVGQKKVSKITFATIGSVKDHIDEFKHFKYIMVDECFTGETEILTEKGWQRFDRLDHSLKVAQYNNGIVSFVYPNRYIEREHDGDMCRFTIRQNIQVPMTCGHELLLYNPQKDIYKKVTVDNFTPNSHWRIPLAGVCEMADEELTPLERLYIAFQADGSFQMVTRNYTKGIFSFTKERKIDRFKMLCHLANIKYSEIKDKNDNRHRFIATFPAGTTKFIRKHIKFPMSYQKARAVLEECALWDGYVQNDHTLYYGSTIEDNTNFYSEVAALAGYSAIKTIQHDDRETFYKDVHRLFVHKNKTSKDTQTASVEHYYYKGKVYCVDVPSHNIVIRHNGYSFVTGNCHGLGTDNDEGMYIKFLSMLDCKVLGLTATPYRLYADTRFDYVTRKMTTVNARLLMLPQVPNPFFTRILYIVQNREMFEKGYLCSPTYYEVKPPRWNEDRMFANTSGSDYSSKSVQWMMEQSDMTKHLISICRRLLQPKNGKPRNGILVFTQFVEDAEEICANVAYSAFVCGTTTKKNRERIINEFKEGKIKVLVNVSTLSTGFNVPSLDTVVLGRPTLSMALYLQQVGRCVRRFEGKDAWVIDCVGNTKRFGHMENVWIGRMNGSQHEEVYGWITDKGHPQGHWKQLTGVPLKASEENLFHK